VYTAKITATLTASIFVEKIDFVSAAVIIVPVIRRPNFRELIFLFHFTLKKKKV